MTALTRKPFPLGKVCRPYARVVQPADRPPLVMLNRYPGQVIGIGMALPSRHDSRCAIRRWCGFVRRWCDCRTWDAIDQHQGSSPTGFPRHRALSIVWAKPDRWWRS